MKGLMKKRLQGLMALALALGLFLGSTVTVKAAEFTRAYAGWVYTDLSAHSEIAPGDIIKATSGGGFLIIYNDSEPTAGSSSMDINGTTYYKQYTIAPTPAGEAAWRIDNIQMTDDGITNCDGYTMWLSTPSSESDGGGKHTSRDHRERHKTTDSKKYDYAETENGIAYGGFVDGKWAATTMVPASAYPKFSQFIIKKISQAESGKDIVMNCEPWTSLPKEVLEAFAAKGDVSLTLNYTLEGNRYTVKVPAGTDISTLVDENGYSGLAYLGAKLGALPYIESTAE